MLLTKHQGFGLIEALIASGIVVAVAASSVGLASVIVKNTTAFDQQIIATNLAGEALEAAHWRRDYNVSDRDSNTDWSDGLTSADCISGCKIVRSNNFNDPSFEYSFTPGSDLITLNGNQYERTLYFKDDYLAGAGENKIIAEAIVEDESGRVIADLSTNLTNWRQVK